MTLTPDEIKRILPRIPREDKEMMLRLTHEERMVILELYRQFPGAHHVDDDPPVEEAKPTQLGPDDPFPEGFGSHSRNPGKTGWRPK